MPRALNISVVDDDDENYDSSSTLTDHNAAAPAPSLCPTTTNSATKQVSFPGVEGIREAHTYPLSKRERRNKRQHKLFLQICNDRHQHKKDRSASAAATADAEADAELLRFGVGTYGETEQELQREKVKLKEPRYGRKKLVLPTLRRRESVYDRLRRSSSFAQPSEDGQNSNSNSNNNNNGMRSLTNEKVAERSSKKADERRKSLQEILPPVVQQKDTTPSLPPIAATRDEKGGVLDTYGYFSTHRVNPYYYRELDLQHPSNIHTDNSSGSNNNNISSSEAVGGADGASNRKSTKKERRRSFLSGKVDVATGVAADQQRQRYATKRYEDRQTNKTIEERSYNGMYGADRRRETRQESLYSAVKAF